MGHGDLEDISILTVSLGNRQGRTNDKYSTERITWSVDYRWDSLKSTL